MRTTPSFSLTQSFRLIRPKQWIKNAFVFAPLIFARELFNQPSFILALRAFVAFCCTASAVYIINDLADLESDRAHPEKKHRPLAAGTLSISNALVIMALLLLGAAVSAAGMDGRFLVLLGTYFVINLAYSWKLREVFLLDVFIIAAGFMLRVLGGASAIGVTVSSWLVLCSLFISLFLGFAKRRGELVQWEQSGATARRKTLLLYRLDFIDQLLTVAAAGTVISYALYTVAPRTIEVFGTDRLIYTTVFVMYGVFRYMYLVHTSSAVGNPTGAVTSDLPIIINAFFWIAACVFLIYFGGSIPVFSR
jgi:4-hydroxybenzoate polyprenyltransferase